MTLNNGNIRDWIGGIALTALIGLSILNFVKISDIRQDNAILRSELSNMKDLISSTKFDTDKRIEYIILRLDNLEQGKHPSTANRFTEDEANLLKSELKNWVIENYEKK